MRIVTRPDFDGIVCAALLKEAEPVDEPILWVQPSEVQQGLIPVKPGDIVANLPHIPGCRLWFDHHVTNQIDTPFQGRFQVAPSAARLVYEYYREHFAGKYDELLEHTDKIDAADLTADEILHPENYPYLLLSMTISGREEQEEAYWNKLAACITSLDIRRLGNDPEIKARCERVVDQNRAYAQLLKDHTAMESAVAVTDFRGFVPAPEGNRYLVYSLFPQSNVQVKIRYADEHRQRTIIGIGRSILNGTCRVNAGRLLAQFGGGGHAGAGSCTIPSYQAETVLPRILETLKANQPN